MSKLNAFVGASYAVLGHCPSCGSQRGRAQRWEVQRNQFLVEYRGQNARVCTICASILDLDTLKAKQFLGAGI